MIPILVLSFTIAAFWGAFVIVAFLALGRLYRLGHAPHSPEAESALHATLIVFAPIAAPVTWLVVAAVEALRAMEDA